MQPGAGGSHSATLSQLGGSRAAACATAPPGLHGAQSRLNTVASPRQDASAVGGHREVSILFSVGVGGGEESRRLHLASIRRTRAS